MKTSGFPFFEARAVKPGGQANFRDQVDRRISPFLGGFCQERLFGLTNSEGNHGEDVKEYYFYLDSTPTHSYMKWLYKYPQGEYPYENLIETNRRRSHNDFEYELIDTGIFKDDRYFDVYVEYAKETPEEILIRISVSNRGPEPATLHLLPTFWFRNAWTWWPDTPKPGLRQVSGPASMRIIAATHADLGDRWLYIDGGVPLLFTENETNNERIFGKPNSSPYLKDEICFQMASHDSDYDDFAAKFGDHFLWIAHSMNRLGPDGMWDEEDGFYYDVLRLPDGTATRLKVRSMVGLLPLCATTVVEPWQRERLPHFLDLFALRLRRMPWLLESIHPSGPGHLGVAGRGIAALVGPDRLRRILSRMLDENEFLSPYGIRAVSRYHAEHPYVFNVHGAEYRVDYLPAESNTGMFGGNSNWRGPIWMPVNVMLIRALLQFYLYYGDHFKIECPTGSGKLMNLFEVSKEISNRLQRIFLRDERGRRPVYGGTEKFQNDPHWKDLLLFHEYFHGDNGAGLGASHQTGWTGSVAKLIQLYGYLDPRKMLEAGRAAAFLRQD